ncbi:ATP binding domain 4 [Gonapodya sp. JEL0774]|nr:ATP binding domain 4 [Gonapodya sp. JEL0774]
MAARFRRLEATVGRSAWRDEAINSTAARDKAASSSSDESLASGGKDSTLALLHCVAMGHKIVALANIHPFEPVARSDVEAASGEPVSADLDSYMFQTVASEAVELFARAAELPLFRRRTLGKAVCKTQEYVVGGTFDDMGNPYFSSQSDDRGHEEMKTVSNRAEIHSSDPLPPSDTDEVEDLFILLREARDSTGADAVCSGAILSSYQRGRVEGVCLRLNLTSISPLWRRYAHDPILVLHELDSALVEAVLVKVASLGLSRRLLGRTVSSLKPLLHEASQLYQINPAGEGGEYETFTLDCPLFRNKRIELLRTSIYPEDALDDPLLAPAAHLRILEARLVEKSSPPDNSWIDALRVVQSEVWEEVGRMWSAKETHVDSVDDAMDAMEFLNAVEVDSSRLASGETIADPQLPLVSEQGPVICSTCTPAALGVTWGNADSGKKIEDDVWYALNCLYENLTHSNIPKSSVSLVHLYVSSMADFARVNAAYVKFWGVGPPARVTVQLPLQGRRVHLDATAVVANIHRDALHVQGISYWAPANIGPYSQAVAAGPILFLAGQIPLVPHTMTLPTSNEISATLSAIQSHSRLALRNVAAVVDSMGGILSEDAVGAVGWVVDRKDISCLRRDWEALTVGFQFDDRVELNSR